MSVIKTEIQMAINEIRQMRMEASSSKLTAFRNKFPEIHGGEVLPLSDEEIILEALRREYRYCQTLKRDM